MLALSLLIIVGCLVAGIIGFVVDGLFWLFIVACVLLVVTILGTAYLRGRAASRKRPR